MFDFRLKRAHVALADGRLDEAYELLSDLALREHRAGQKLLGRLSEAFIRRGMEHLSGNRLAPALQDCNRAEKLAGNVAGVSELRTRICSQIEAVRAESQLQAEQLARVKEQMQKGWFSTGRKILAQAEENQQAQSLLKNAEMLQTENDSALRRIEQALKAGQIEMAGRIFQLSALNSSISEQAADVLERIRTQAGQKLNTLWDAGDLQRAEAFLNQLSDCVRQSETLLPFAHALELCRQAAAQIEAGHFDAVGMALRKIRNLLPQARWLDELIDNAQAAAQAKQELLAGPLGILTDVSDARDPIQQTAQSKPEPVIKTHVPVVDPIRPAKAMAFILQIDGIGAYYVFSGDRVTLGPVSASQRSDIELVTAPDVQTKQIERIDGDYFFGDANQAVRVAPASNRLLADHDRIELSPRCRFKFALPNPASSTACLMPSSARFPRADINGVILMAREILIGPERNCHIQSGQVTEQAMLYLHDQQIRCRTAQPIRVDGKPCRPDMGLPMNTPFEIGQLRVVMTVRND